MAQTLINGNQINEQSLFTTGVDVGKATFTGTSVITVSATGVTGNSVIFLTFATIPAPTTDTLSVDYASIVPGMSFDVHSLGVSVKTFSWLIINPS